MKEENNLTKFSKLNPYIRNDFYLRPYEIKPRMVLSTHNFLCKL